MYGLGERDDATVFTVDTNEELLATVATAGWPAYVEFVHDDGLHAVREFAPFDLVFADAAGGKLDGLDVTIDALDARWRADRRRHGSGAARRRRFARSRSGRCGDQILGDPSLVAAELDFASGVIVATKRARVS